MSKPLIIGVGNRWRSDDGVGPWAADRLAERGLEAVEESGEGARLIALFEAHEDVVVIDAMRSGAATGTLRRFETATEPLPAGCFHYSSHQFALAEAVETARALGRLPRRLIVFGIEGGAWGYGNALSAPVRAAASALVEVIAQESG
jgi:hydrogenase maturation protease